jgi:hypothetical protein
VVIASIIAIVVIARLFPSTTAPTPGPGGGQIIRKPLLIIIVDNSYSTVMFCDDVAFWINRFYLQADPDSNCVIVKMSHDASIIYDASVLPTLSQLRDNATLKKLELDTKPKTRPLLAFQLVNQIVAERADKDVSLLFITDGENDFAADETAIDASCKSLTAHANVLAIAMIGVDDSLRMKWSGRFSTSAGNCSIVRGVTDATDGIDSLVKIATRGGF